ncbi:MAG: hypothetical protein AABZ02_08880, partial [Bacteroidota bacterium]
EFVDAYYGPPQWRDEVKLAGMSLAAIQQSVTDVRDQLRGTSVDSADDMHQLRRRYLVKQLNAMIARIEMLKGKKFSFDEEAQALYDAKPPRHTEDDFKEILRSLDRLLPGTGPTTQRYEEFRKAFVIPGEKLDAVFQAAITECWRRTKKRIELPSHESFNLEYVKNKSWSGYNWYKGNSHSLIQINTDLPIYIDRAVDLAAHEGYPGHHVYNTLLEQHLARERKWVEFTVYALFSPQSLIAEGTANFGIEVAFPGTERVEFERNVLFPLVGMDSEPAEHYYEIHRLATKLNYAHNEAARRYLDGDFKREQAEEFLVAYALMSRDRAKQRVRFIDTYRSYVINYNLGQDLVKRYVESRGGTSDHPDKRWEEFKGLLSSPRLPSALFSS